MTNIPVILGPTSTGKTSLGIKVALELGYEIISVDSRQMFIGMDIGTGKTPINSSFKIKKGPKKWVINNVNVWGYDLVKPNQYFSAYDFAKWTLEKMGELLKQGKKVMLVGGTGFFIDFITGMAMPGEYPLNIKLRNKLEKKNITELQAYLMSLNMEVLKRVDKNNPIRLIRAIEIESKEGNIRTPLPYLRNVNFLYMGLTSTRDFLYQRSDQWVDSIWQDDLIRETETLIKKGFSKTRPLNGLIYKSVRSYLNKELSKEEAIQRCKFDVHAYIRRQQTYFKRNKDIVWFDIAQEGFAYQIINKVQSV